VLKGMFFIFVSISIKKNIIIIPKKRILKNKKRGAYIF
jgi:hypothetical protein